MCSQIYNTIIVYKYTHKPMGYTTNYTTDQLKNRLFHLEEYAKRITGIPYVKINTETMEVLFALEENIPILDYRSLIVPFRGITPSTKLSPSFTKFIKTYTDTGNSNLSLISEFLYALNMEFCCV